MGLIFSLFINLVLKINLLKYKKIKRILDLFFRLTIYKVQNGDYKRPGMHLHSCSAGHNTS